jgi:hypothetical protein
MVDLEWQAAMFDILSEYGRVGCPSGVVDVELLEDEYPSLIKTINAMITLPCFL